MTQLVHHHMAHQRRRQEQQLRVQGDYLAAGTAAPTGALAPYIGMPMAKAEARTHFLKLRNQTFVRFSRQPARESGAARVLVVKLSVHEQARRSPFPTASPPALRLSSHELPDPADPR